jgi:dipeptidyl aminopeptidase/acylaminoacyl peptidase
MLRLALTAAGFALPALFCLNAAAQTAAPQFIEPNEHLSAQGILPIPQSTADLAGRYNDFRVRSLVDWNPVKREMLIATRTKGVAIQLHLLRKPLGQLEQLTDFADPVRNASFEPKKGAYLVFEKDEGGSEANQLYRLDLNGTAGAHKVTLLTDPKEKHSAGPWNHRGDQLVLASTQLDKTAGSARRAQVSTDIWLLDPLKPETKRRVIGLPGGGWGGFQWSNDDSSLLAVNDKSINESSVWLIDIDSGLARPILPLPDPKADGKEGRPAAPQVQYGNVHFTPDGKSILATSDRDGEFRQLMRIELGSLKSVTLSKDIAWDVANIEPAKEGNQVAALINRDGLDELHLFDSANARELARPVLPAGGVTRVRWHGASEIGFDLNSAQSQGEVYTLNLKSGKVEQWTRPYKDSHAGIDTSHFKNADIIRWTSFDKQSISGLIARPPAGKFKGPRPVLVLIHGGPEGQAKIGFLGRNNYLLNELGIVLIQPNVRGSAGFGKTFLKRDNGMLREDSVKDIGALFDWIGAQPELDAKHVAVMGGSYGGYMSLAVATNYADRITGAIDVVGISNFVSFLERTESYRRDLRRAEYGDERVPEMRAFMERIAPLNNAQKITKPLFVIQGKNDPRVPLNEAEQMVAKVRDNKTPVWYLVADNEGHGFARKPNTDFYFFSVVRFLEEYLLK